MIDPIAKEVSKEFVSETPTTLWDDSEWLPIFNIQNKNRGIFGEEWIKQRLTLEGYKVDKGITSFHHGEKGCDLVVNDTIRVEVKLGFALKNSGGTKLCLDSSIWQHLDETTADVYTLIGINPDRHLDYHVRRGWRTEHEPYYIIYVTKEKLSDLIEKGKAAAQYDGWQLGSKFLKYIDYGYDMRNFPY